MENPIQMDDLGVPLFLETPTLHLKMDGWNTIVSFWEDLFSEANCYFQGVYLYIVKNFMASHG